MLPHATTLDSKAQWKFNNALKAVAIHRKRNFKCDRTDVGLVALSRARGTGKDRLVVGLIAMKMTLPQRMI
jgi:hypothetical protein